MSAKAQIKLGDWWRRSAMVRMGLSLACVSALYGTYTLVAVPWIEPGVVRSERPRPMGAEIAGAPPSPLRERLVGLFPPGSWELKDPTTIESRNSILLLREYKTLPDGGVFIQPCTIVHFPGISEGVEEPSDRRYVLIRVPEGAELRFDRPFSLRQVGQLVGGRLLGPISIDGQTGKSGDEGRFWAATRDAQITEDYLWTPHDVSFSWNHNEGRGRELRLNFVRKGSSEDARLLSFGALESMLVSKDVSLELDIPSDAIWTVDPARIMDPGSARRPSPENATPRNRVRVASQGAFRFSLREQKLSFEDRVDVLQFRPGAPSDQLLCEHLEILLGPKNPTSSREGERDQGATGIFNLEPKSIIARGDPVVLNSPSDDAQARGQYLRYDLETQTLLIRSSGMRHASGPPNSSGVASLEWNPAAAAVRFRQTTLQAPWIEYQRGNSGSPGQVRMQGPGWISSGSASGKEAELVVSWSTSLALRPRDERQLLSILGDAFVQYGGQGTVRGEEIWVWLMQHAPESTAATGGSVKLSPDYLYARGRVSGDSKALSLEAEELKAWFRYPAGNPAASPKLPSMAVTTGARAVAYPLPQPVSAAPRREPFVGASTSPAGEGHGGSEKRDRLQDPFASGGQPIPPEAHHGPGGSPEQRADHFHVRAPALRLQFVVVGKEPKLSDAQLLDFVSGESRFSSASAPESTSQGLSPIEIVQTGLGRPGQRPLAVRGRRALLARADTENAYVSVEGTPAQLEGEGAKLEAALIQAHQGQNRVWADGAGRLHLPMDTDLQGRPLASPRMAEVVWNQGMNFDGRTVRCQGGVVATSDFQEIHADALEATLAEWVSLRQGQLLSTAGRPKSIRFLGTVYARSHTYDGQTLQSIDHVTGSTLAVDLSQESVVVEGPGEIVSWRLGRVFGGAGPALTSQAVPRTTAQRETLSYLRVTFQDQLQGRSRDKELSLRGAVAAVFGPVADWSASIPMEDARQLEEGQFLVRCGRLVVRDIASVSGGSQIELEAWENTHVDGNAFSADADRLSYSQQKDLLVLESMGYRNSELRQAAGMGRTPGSLSARVIRYWPGSRKIEIGGFSRSQVN